jgi:hypothetical protein
LRKVTISRLVVRNSLKLKQKNNRIKADPVIFLR